MNDISPLPQAFLERMQFLLPDSDFQNITQYFLGKQRIYFVINPFKNSVDKTIKTLKTLDVDLLAHPEIPLFGKLTWSIGHQFKEILTYHETHNLGYFYIIGLPSILTVAALAPNSNDRVLDLTAAPGGKTFLMAILMNNQGEIIANDLSKSRFFKLKANLDRLNITNTTFKLSDGKRINKIYSQYFDKVLLDAPCSCESRFNLNNKKTMKYWSLSKIKASTSSQKQLILNAFRACKPNGHMVYSTCTFAPEENEGIIYYLTQKHPNAIIDKIKSPYGQSGLTIWNKVEYPEGFKTLRILNNYDYTGGCITKIVA